MSRVQFMLPQRSMAANGIGTINSNFTHCTGSGAILAYGDTSCSHAHAASHLNLFFFCMQAAQQDGAPLLHTGSLLSGLAMASSDSPGGVTLTLLELVIFESIWTPDELANGWCSATPYLANEAGVRTLPALSSRSRELGSSRGMGRLHFP
ncbi:uncharacterized protein PSANT_00084 [Moesziomyces antarcticus]|uniref:Uncharacterized protein n=3 Tax=Pseudozyma antarctica TaxID=84753 RepID=A0A5C3FFV5_PSEA2|nr:uncharacterized protein PSANT_00084 [Moesziomyces antarcticus]